MQMFWPILSRKMERPIYFPARCNIILNTVRILGELKTHRLAFIRWYQPAPNHHTRFYTNIDSNEKSSNIELWQNEFFGIERDCLIPIHYLYSRFVSSKFVIGKKNPITYNAVIPINRQFHL